MRGASPAAIVASADSMPLTVGGRERISPRRALLGRGRRRGCGRAGTRGTMMAGSRLCGGTSCGMPSDAASTSRIEGVTSVSTLRATRGAGAAGAAGGVTAAKPGFVDSAARASPGPAASSPPP